MGRLLLGVGGAFLAAGMAGSLALALWPPLRSLYYRNPRLPTGWVVERQRHFIRGGAYWLTTKLVHAGGESLRPGSLCIRCNRPVLKAEFNMPRAGGILGTSYMAQATCDIDHRGVVTLSVPVVDHPGAPFYFEGYLQSDGPLRVWRVGFAAV